MWARILAGLAAAGVEWAQKKIEERQALERARVAESTATRAEADAAADADRAKDQPGTAELAAAVEAAERRKRDPG